MKTGFEMLIDNFSMGIIGMLMAIAGMLYLGPFIEAGVGIVSGGVEWLQVRNLIPLMSVIVEPAKVLFLNNALTHGIFTPLGVAEAADAGRSILFMVESNPGAGLGLLTAFMLFGPRSLRPSTPGAILIHFFGGIHEIYFPYVLMKPVMILAMIAGSMSGLFVGGLVNAGLVAPAAPGSILAYFAVTPPGGYLSMIITVLVAAAVSFVVASALLRFGRGSNDIPDEAAAVKATAELGAPIAGASIAGSAIRKVIIACDAGMGSSVMVASTMKKKLAPYGIEVTHTPVDQIPADAQLVLTQDGLVDRAEKNAPHAVIVPFTNYMGDPAFDRVEQGVKEGRHISKHGLGDVADGAAAETAPVATATATATKPKRAKKTLDPSILPEGNVRLGLRAMSKDDAIRQAGQVLVDAGAAQPGYIEGMLARELQTTTFLGQGVAIPHGTNEARTHINKAALGFLQFPDGVDWDGKTAYVVIPIASNSDEHVSILAALASTLADKSKSEQLRTAA
ncbi:MAG: PTS sugar transporter subunit IIA, partial [Hyphomicrobiaceae bacterium]